jgi:hypothetical protein
MQTKSFDSLCRVRFCGSAAVLHGWACFKHHITLCLIPDKGIRLSKSVQSRHISIRISARQGVGSFAHPDAAFFAHEEQL